MTYLVCLLLFLSSATAIDILFSSTTYYGAVAILEDPIGKVVTETQLVYDENLVKNFTTKDYNLFRTDGNYFNVDKNGIIRLKAMLPSRRVYIFQVSLLYIVTLNDNTTQSAFLSANVQVQAIGPVHFDNSTYRIVVSTNLQPNEPVYDFSKHVVYNRSAFDSVYYEFDYVNSSYFTMDAFSGILYVRRALYPTSFSVRIEIEYDVTLKNGTVVSDDEYVYATIVALGCRGEEEMRAFWPDTYTCSAFRVPCGDLDNGAYFSDGFATRVCNAEGDWLPPDYSNCSVKAGTKPFGLIWMTFSTASGTSVLSQLSRIVDQIEDLFPADSVSNINAVSAFRSNVQYGFMIGFKMDVNSSALNNSDIAAAQRALNRLYRISSLYLRSSRSIQGKGLRLFKGIESQCGSQETIDTKYLEVCSGDGCNCSSTTIYSNGSCNNVELRKKEGNEAPTIGRSGTEPSYLTLNASDYYRNISAFAPKGTYILTVGFNISGNRVANISNFHYDISGYYSDYFKIDRRLGHLTVNDELVSRTYRFNVSFFYTVTYTNGTVGYNYTESDILITAYAGVGFNASSYYITVDANYILNETVLTTMSNFLSYDNSFQLQSLEFYYISDARFSVDKITGDIKVIHHLDPLHTHNVTVYLRYIGTTSLTDRFYHSTTSTLVQIYTMGCFEVESGSVVWPASHVCTSAVHSCYDIDHAFNQSGIATRYCSNTGEWQDPDFSQCYFKSGAKPFVHLYFTFYTLSQSHILANLQGIIRSGNGLLSPLGINDLAPYYIKESVINNGMVVTLRGEATPNDTILTHINNTISQYRTFARIRLQRIGNGIIGFSTSNKCEYPTYPTNAQNVTKFFAVCQKGENVSCDCDPLTPTVGLCNSTSVSPTTTPTSSPTTTPTSGPTTTPTSGYTIAPTIAPRIGLNVSAFSVSNTSVGIQWSDDSPGITNFKVQYSAVIRYNSATGESTYVDTKEITTTDTSYIFTLLTPSTDYTFTVTSYTKDGKDSTVTISQTTAEGRKESPELVIRPRKSPLIVTVGDYLPIHCIAEKGVPIPQVQWHSEGFPVYPSRSFYQQTYVVPTDSPHTTTYTCVGTSEEVIELNVSVTVIVEEPCPRLRAPRRGEVTTTEDGQLAFFSCKQGFTMRGSNFLKCRNGKWDSSPPTCNSISQFCRQRCNF